MIYTRIHIAVLLIKEGSALGCPMFSCYDAYYVLYDRSYEHAKKIYEWTFGREKINSRHFIFYLALKY